MKRIFTTIMATLTILISMTGCNSTPKLTEQEEKCVIAINTVKKDLKDETSMRLYGDVYVIYFPSVKSTMYCFTYDAKNGFGAYNGKTRAEVNIRDDVSYEPFYVTDDSDMFLNAKEEVANFKKKSDLQVDVIELENVCKYMNLELIK